MRLAPATAFASDRALRRAALAAAVIVAVVLLIVFGGLLGRTLGDPDDALRLSMVRDLLHGRGWFDQRIERLQPPLGVYMHWSRLLDGGLALLIWAMTPIFGPANAELFVRMVWPLAWLFPAILAVLALARRLAGTEAAGRAVMLGAVVMALDMPLYGQFDPGRIDHHDVQITLCLLALAAACSHGAGLKGAAGAGIATGLGLAIGLEALPFEAAIGAGLALEFVLTPEDGRRARAYGLALATTAFAAFFIQTPPERWGVSVCDALGANLALALVVAGAGLYGAGRLTCGRSWRWRAGAIGATGVLALVAYLISRPACIHGVFAEVDPRLRPFWFDHISELEPLLTLFKHRAAEALGVILAAALGLGACVRLAIIRRCDRFVIGLAGVCIALALLVGAAAERMSLYVLWFAPAPIIAVLALAAEPGPLRRRRLVRAATFVGAPIALVAGVMALAGVIRLSDVLPDPPDPCFERAAYEVLARQPPGLTLGEVDLGSYVLAYTGSSALSAPYHRMTWGDLAGHALLSAPVDRAEGGVRGLKVAYVLNCPAHRRHFDRSGLAQDTLQRRLDQGRPPSWLKPLSPPDAPVQVYRVVAPVHQILSFTWKSKPSSTSRSASTLAKS